jgi:hypothetical protein
MIHNFNTFLNEADKNTRTATIKASTDVEITRKLEKLLREATKLTDEVEAEKAKYEEAVKIKELELKSKQAAIFEAMQAMNTTTIKFKKILATIESKKGNTTYAYSTLWNFALQQATVSQKKALVEFQEMNKKIGATKLSLVIKKVNEEELNEGLADMLSVIWNFLKEKTAKIVAAFTEYTEAVDALETAVGTLKK